MVKDAVKHVNDEDGNPHTMKMLGAIIKGRCAVGHITGKCTNTSCKFDHEKEVLDHDATAMADLIKKGLKVAKKGRDS